MGGGSLWLKPCVCVHKAECMYLNVAPGRWFVDREIMREIQRLRLEQEAYANESSATTTTTTYNPTLLAELRLLRQRKDELESRMSALQESRKDLMVQLEGLMKLLKVSHSLLIRLANGSEKPCKVPLEII